MFLPKVAAVKGLICPHDEGSPQILLAITARRRLTPVPPGLPPRLSDSPPPDRIPAPNLAPPTAPWPEPSPHKPRVHPGQYQAIINLGNPQKP